MYKKKGLTKRRIFEILIVLTLTVAVAVAGTFAWEAFTQQAVSEAIGAGEADRPDEAYPGPGENYGGRVHNHFEGTSKLVFVENFNDEEEGEAIFVRVRLTEDLQIAEAADDELELLPLEDWVAIVNGESSFEELTLTLGGNHAFIPTLNRNFYNQASDISGNPDLDDFTNMVSDPAFASNVPAAFIDDITAGITYPARAGTLLQSVLDGNSGDHVVRETADFNRAAVVAEAEEVEVILIEDWDGVTTGNFWVIDGEWAYWANALEPGAATSLLVNGVTFDASDIYFDLPWHYGIHVNGQFTNADDLEAFIDVNAIGDDAAKLLNIAAGNDVGGGQSELAQAIENALAGNMRFTDDEGMAWRILTVDNNNNALIITEHVYGRPTVYNSNATTATRDYTRFEISNLKAQMDIWWADTDRSEALKAAALRPTHTNSENNNIAPWGSAHSTPTHTVFVTAAINAAGAPASGTTAGVVFALSMSEANTYFEGTNIPPATGNNAPVQDLRAPLAGTSSYVNWWLRSPGQGLNTRIASCVNMNGLRDFTMAEDTMQGFRPALWIDIDAIN